MPDEKEGLFLKEVNIYIDVNHTGHLKKGRGVYCIMLEYIADGEPFTREYYEGMYNTTLNRTAVEACIEALSYLIQECIVNLTLNSAYVCRAVNEGLLDQWISTGKNAKGQPTKNMDLWQQLYDYGDQHDITYIYAESNPYTAYMRTQLKSKEIEYKEDAGNV